MNLVKLNPMNEVMGLRNYMDRMFDDMFVPMRRHGSEETALSSWQPSVDVFENDDAYVVNAELPGVDKKDIDVDLKNRVLTISGSRSHENEVKEGKYYRKECSYGKFQRSFTLPDSVKADDISADYKDGVLKVTIPKSEAEKPKQITIH